MKATLLIAPCGLNCAACYAHLRRRNACPGCRVNDADKSVNRVRCRMRTCKEMHGTGRKYCFQCSHMPCETLERLDKRYRSKYYARPIENLVFIKKNGIRKFLQSENERWKCLACKGKVCAQTNCCVACGK